MKCRARIHRCTSLLVTGLLLAGFASATTYRQLSLTEMLHQSEIAFLGTVSSVSVELREGEPWTIVEFEVERFLLGTGSDDRVQLAFFGGELPGGENLRVNLMPTFDVGEEVLLLAYDEEYYSPVVGFNQGLWRVDGGEFRSVQGVRLGLDPQGQLLEGAQGGSPDGIVDAVAQELEAP